MKTVYFIFKNMKEAEYYYRGIAYSFQNFKIIATRNPYKIILPRIKEQKENLIGKILIKLGLKQPKYENNDIEIIFKSEKSKQKIPGSIDTYYFFEDEYEIEYFLDLINKI